MFKMIFIILFLLNTSLFAKELSNMSNQFPLQMLNLSTKDVFISFRTDIGLVYFDEPLEDNTLLPAGRYSYLFGVNFAPRDPQSRFKIIFDGEKQCIFTIGYFKFPSAPPVTFAGNGCEGSGYRVEQCSGYDTLVLYIV